MLRRETETESVGVGVGYIRFMMACQGEDLNASDEWRILLLSKVFPQILSLIEP